MEGKAGTLHERWLQRTEAAYRRMFEGKSQEELVTLTQRENMAMLIAKELAAFVLEEHVAMDSAAQPAEASTTCCPKCGQPGTPAVEGSETLPERTVTTRAGDIRVRRQRWRCAKCRVVFFPLDVRLRLGTEGYSPAVLAKAVRQASKASSFAEASDDLRELADLEISATHLWRLSERIGEEWVEVRDEEVEKFRQAKLERSYQEPPGGAAAVMLDGGRLQTRAEDGGRGASPRAGPGETQGLCLRRPSVQLVDLRDAPSAGGVRGDPGFRSPPGVPVRRGPCLSRLGRGAGMEDVRAVAPLGVVGKGRRAAVELARRGCGVGCERIGCGGPKANGRRDVDVRDEQPPAHGLSRVSPLGRADQQRPGRVDDQANQPPSQRQREVLAGRAVLVHRELEFLAA